MQHCSSPSTTGCQKKSKCPLFYKLANIISVNLCIFHLCFVSFLTPKKIFPLQYILIEVKLTLIDRLFILATTLHVHSRLIPEYYWAVLPSMLLPWFWMHVCALIIIIAATAFPNHFCCKYSKGSSNHVPIPTSRSEADPSCPYLSLLNLQQSKRSAEGHSIVQATQCCVPTWQLFGNNSCCRLWTATGEAS